MSSRSSARPAAELRALIAEHGLTQREVAELAGVSIKTVESWMADAAAASHRAMPARHLSMIRHMLPGFLAARRGRKD